MLFRTFVLLEQGDTFGFVEFLTVRKFRKKRAAGRSLIKHKFNR